MDIKTTDKMKIITETDGEITKKSNAFILSTVFNYLHVNKLKQCREICKEWNEVALRKLSKETCFVFDEFTPDWDYTARKPSLTEAINNRFDLLENSYYPEFLLRNVKFSSEICDRAAPTILICFIQKYGKYFKSINFEPIQLSVFQNSDLIQDTILHLMLTSWCPNMINLDVGETEADLQYLRLQEQTGEPITSPLNLKSFSLAERPGLPSSILKWLSAVLNQCPDLKSLRLIAVGEFSELSSENETIFDSLVDFPNIARNLETLTCTILNDNEYQKKFLFETYNLKKLRLEGEFTDELAMLPISCFSNIKDSLVYLDLKNLCLGMDKYGVVSLAQEFRNLKFFKVTAKIINDIVPIQPFTSQLDKLKQNPNKNLKKLLLLKSYNEVWNTELVETLVTGFPNLEYLHLDFGVRDEKWIAERAKLSDVLSILSKLKFLKELVVGIYIEDKTELIGAIPFICDFQKLQCISIGFMYKREVKKNTTAVRVSEKYSKFRSATDLVFEYDELKLMQNLQYASDLRNIRFIDFKISKPTIAVSNFIKNIKVSLLTWQLFDEERLAWSWHAPF